ncbi:MAG: hypothetical protein ACI3YG_00350 [Prevotella sp.]
MLTSLNVRERVLTREIRDLSCEEQADIASSIRPSGTDNIIPRLYP